MLLIFFCIYITIFDIFQRYCEFITIAEFVKSQLFSLAVDVTSLKFFEFLLRSSIELAHRKRAEIWSCLSHNQHGGDFHVYIHTCAKEQLIVNATRDSHVAHTISPMQFRVGISSSPSPGCSTFSFVFTRLVALNVTFPSMWERVARTPRSKWIERE